MKHTNDFIVLFYKDDEDWQTISAFEVADIKSIKWQIERVMKNWEYDIDEVFSELIDTITDSLYGDNYYEDDVFVFKIEYVPFFS
jgi:hypothetical protein